VYLTHHLTKSGPRWAVDGKLLPPALTLSALLSMPEGDMLCVLSSAATGDAAAGTLLAPIDEHQEVWAAGVTYLRSRDARQAESKVGDVYQRVYEAERPELFFKAAGWRVQGYGMPMHIRCDSRWNVPEPEMVIVANHLGEIIGYCAGNDMSSRDIEGENPLYLPQAKVYNRSCALGPGIILAEPDDLRDLPIGLTIARQGIAVFTGSARTSQMKRTPEELVAYLQKEMAFPYGVLLMTGTCVVPPDTFSLLAGDVVSVAVGALTLVTPVD
jgi:2-dehydro-3-deoxy-D-arabinonate dehydratase